MNGDISVLAELNMELGECPRWNNLEQAWYWVDITGKTLYRFCTESEVLSHRHFSFQPAAFFFTEHNEIILTSSSGIYLIDDFSSDEVLLGNPESDKPENRFNDGTSTPDGQFICGSIGNGEQPVGISYWFTFKQGKLTYRTLHEQYTIINGQAFSPDGQWYYVTDTPKQEVLKYPYYSAEQTLGEPQLFYSFKETNEFPDGAAIDKDGNYWIALYGSGKICQISPKGKRIQDIVLPVSQPTMVTFGGSDLTTLVITSANQGLSAAQLEEEPLAGSVLQLKTNASGLPPILIKT